ncbi:MAG: DUF4831 family protein [Prevotella sp.]|nr:DUF4831 family protein [Prevotella sp.]
MYGRYIDRLLVCLVLFITGYTTISAQKTSDVEGTGYYLPRTELRFTVRMEKTSYTPGEYAIYAEKYLRITDVSLKPSVSYRIIDFKINSIGERDTSKFYVAPTDSKHNIQSLRLDDSGTLLAINAEPKVVSLPETFKPAPKPKALNPRDFMTEDILSAGSSAKMAELCALEIYDIRESRNMLNKGQADFMPNDGQQMRMMLQNLDRQETGLLQLFNGITVKDTLDAVIEFVPTKSTDRQLLFRFSKWLGITEDDDLAGNPYFISVEDKQISAQIQESLLNAKKLKDNVGLYVNVPGKIKVTVYDGEKEWTAYELYAAQFGRTEALSDELFSKKMFTNLVLNPVTGSIESINTDVAKK